MKKSLDQLPVNIPWHTSKITKPELSLIGFGIVYIFHQKYQSRGNLCSNCFMTIFLCESETTEVGETKRRTQVKSLINELNREKEGGKKYSKAPSLQTCSILSSIFTILLLSLDYATLNGLLLQYYVKECFFNERTTTKHNNKPC